MANWEARSRSHLDVDRDPDETPVRRRQPVVSASQGAVAQQHTSPAESIATSSSSDPAMEPRNLN